MFVASDAIYNTCIGFSESVRKHATSEVICALVTTAAEPSLSDGPAKLLTQLPLQLPAPTTCILNALSTSVRKYLFTFLTEYELFYFFLLVWGFRKKRKKEKNLQACRNKTSGGYNLSILCEL